MNFVVCQDNEKLIDETDLKECIEAETVACDSC